MHGLAAVTRETTLFALVGLIAGGLDDLLVDLLWLAGLLRRRIGRAGTADALPDAARPGRLAIFVPAWDEAAVIGPMLRAALGRLAHPDYRIFVGTYPNDPATVAAVAAVDDPRVIAVPGVRPGPTTKAECLNRCWAALVADEAASRIRYKAVLLHDAEDVVHPLELKVVDRLAERYDLIQLPVLPLVDAGARLVSGHYADEFAELHGRQLPVRQMLGAGIPAAGVGCALGRAVLARLAAGRAGPFDASSLTEDYEIGLRMRGLGARATFAVLPAGPGQPLVAVRAFFPATLGAAVRQKTRWLIGIACAGWDRLGWRGGLPERWMRLRDRRAILAAAVLAASYLSLLLMAACWMLGVAIGWPTWAGVAFRVTGGLLVWRLALRCLAVWRFYGWREGLWSLPRLLVANLILMLAAARAFATYRPGVTPAWDKTAHRFPDGVACE